ncbi:type II secretion system protein [Synoicihabitans lomoniglobus]|uniref:Type II secretion system protein n=1 Tax=Synoicihabitans lomoniglobus TaxID=2909285 RepID=A0AAE9ZV99_9BACT|nr:type II secretion system GspH family protein [Opitutaceae bacterium LMO-M01]WED64771.1 type II secretion system protein [Opitutaceae bacterium LMO-M01]
MKIALSLRLSSHRSSVAAFSLLEVMIAVMFIGLFISIGIPAFARVRENSVNAAAASTLLVFGDAFESYARTNGDWPDDVPVGVVPPEMQGRINRVQWETPAPGGGVWDWECDRASGRVGIAIVGSLLALDEMVAIDALIDDGNLAKGHFRRLPSGKPMWLLAE